MRNPLNAILEHNNKQKRHVKELTDLVSSILDEPAKIAELEPRIEELQNLIEESLDAQSSSANLTLFNVEDILALPQLKSGKFTRTIEENHICPAIREITMIMDTKANSKGIHISVDYSGFP